MGHPLRVYWYEIHPSEGIMAHWGQLGHAALRLKFSINEMETSINDLKDLQSIYRIHYQIENYYVRAYELIERLCSLVAALTNNKNAKRMLFDPSQQMKIISALPKSAKGCVAPLKRIINVLHDDIKIRNVHTHSVFIRIGFYMESRHLDIEDLYWDFEEDAVTMGKIFENIRKGGKRLIKEYKVRTEYIDNNVNLFLKGLIPYMREASV